MIRLEQHAEGVVLPVHAHPGARKSEIKGIHDGALKVAITQIAEGGKANRAILNLLVCQLRFRKRDLRILSGHTSRQKRILICNSTVDEVRSRIPLAT